MLKCNICGYVKSDNQLTNCPVCNSIDWIDEDIEILYKISHDNEFLNAMIELKEKDIIEYNIKMSQFRASIAQKESAQKVSDNERNKPRCPTCGSTNLHKITSSERTASIVGFGLFSRKKDKTWKCNNCGSMW